MSKSVIIPIVILALIAACLLFLARYQKNKNAPKIEEEKTERLKIRIDWRKWRRENGGIFGRRRRTVPEDQKKDDAPNNNVPVVPKKRTGLFGWRRRRLEEKRNQGGIVK